MKTFAKVLAVLMALALMISLVACGSNDSKEEKKDDAAATEAATEAAATIVGTWESTDAPGSFYVFNADGTGAIAASGFSIGFTYTDDGAAVTIANGNDASQTQKCQYAIDGDTLTLTDEETQTALTYKRVDSLPEETVDPDATENNSKLVGDWEGEQNSIAVIYTFNANGTGVMKGGATTVTYTYTDDGATVTLTIGDQEPASASYTIEGDKLTIQPEDGEEIVLTKKQ